MKKKLALIVSIVLVLSAMVCLLVSPTSADVAPYYDAAEVADSIWENAPNKVTSVTYNGNTIPASDTEASLVDLNIGFTAGTYTLVDGVLTLNNVAVATPNLRLAAAGSLKLIINGADLYATVANDYDPRGDLLITSETGNKIIADASSAIRTSDNLVVYGNVGFELAYSASADCPIVLDNYGADAAQKIILCPEVDSTVSVAGNYAMRNERGGIVLGGSANLNIVTPAYHAVKSSGDVEILGTGSVTFDADYRLFPNVANVIIKEDVTLSMDTGASTCFQGNAVTIADNADITITAGQYAFLNGNVAIGDNTQVTVNGSSALTYGPGYTFEVAGNAKVSMETSASHALYAYNATIKDNAEVVLKTASDNAVHNASLDISGNAVVSVHTDSTSGAVINSTATPLSVKGNATLNVTGTATNGIHLHYGALAISDSASVNLDVAADYGIGLQEYAPMTMTGGSVIMTGEYAYAGIDAGYATSPVSITGGTVNMMLPGARAFFQADKSGAAITIGKAATVSGVASQLFCAFETATLTFEALDSGAASNVSLIGTNGTTCVGYEAISGFASANLSSAGVPRLFTNSSATAPSADVAVKVTDANGTTELSAASPYYNSVDYGSVVYLPSSNTLYVDNINIVKLETLVDCNLLLVGTNKISNPNANGGALVSSVAGKNLSISGSNATLELVANGGESFALASEGALSIDGVTVTVAAEGSYAVHIVGDVTLTDADLTIAATADTAFRAKAALNVTDSKVVVTAGGQIATSVSGVVTISGSEFSSSTPGQQGLFCSALVVKDSVVTGASTGSYYGIYAASFINIENSDVTAQGGSSNALVSVALNVTNSNLTANAPGTVVNISGDINVKDSTVNATSTGGSYTFASTAGNVTIDNSVMNVSTVGSEGGIAAAAGTLTIQGANSMVTSQDSAYYALRAKNLVIKDGAQVIASTTASETVNIIESAQILNGARLETTSGTHHALNVGTDLTVDSATAVIVATTTEALTNSGGKFTFSGTADVTITSGALGIYVPAATLEVLDNAVLNITNANDAITVSTVNIEGTANIDATAIGIHTTGSINVTGSLNIGANIRPTEGIRVDSGAGNKVVFDGSTSVINTAGYAVNLYASLELINGANVTFNDATNGYGLLIDGDNNGLTVSGGSTLDSNMSTTASAYGIYLGYRTTGANQNILITEGSKVYSDCGNMALRTKGGSITISDSEVITKTWISGNNVYSDVGDIIISGSTVNSTGSNDGNALVINAAGVLSITDGSNVTATATNGDYAVHINGLVTVEDSTLTASATKGYAIRAKGGLTANRSTIGATSSNGGYAVYVNGADLKLNASKLTASGTADVVRSDANTVIENRSVVNVTATTGNYAFYTYGAITVDASDVYVTSAGHTAFRKYASGAGDFRIQNGSYVEVSSGAHYALAVDNADLYIIDSEVVATAATSFTISAGNEYANGNKNIIIENSKVNAINTGGYYAIRATGDISISDSADVYAKTGTSWTVSTLNGDISIDNSEVEIDCTTNNGLTAENAGDIYLYDSVVDVDSTYHAIMANTGNINIEKSTITAKAPGNEDALAAPEGTLTVIDSELDLDARYYSIRANVVDITNSLVDAKNSESYVIKATGAVTFTDSEVYAIAGTHTSIEVGSLNVLGSTYLEAGAMTRTIFADSVTFADDSVSYVTSTAPNAWQAPIQTANLLMEDDAEVYVTIDQTTANASNVLVAVRIDTEGTPTTEATMNLNGGKLDIVVNNAYADANGKDSGDNRTYAIFVKAVAADGVNINGTDITVDLNTKVQNGTTGGILVHQSGGVGPAVINFAKGSITAYAGPNIWNMFYSDISGSQFIVGSEAEIYGSARYFFRGDGAVIDQNLTVKPGAKIDFYSYVKTHDLGTYNNTNLTYYNSYTDKGVEYLNGCALADNGNFLTTANVSKEGDATQVSVILKDGTVVALNLQDRRYPADALAGEEILRFYNDGEGWVVEMNNVKGTKFDANGHVGINLVGDNEIISAGMFAVYSRGELRILGDGTLNAQGTEYVIYAAQNGITISEDATVNGYGTAGTVIHVGRQDPISYLHITDNAKVSVLSDGKSYAHAPIYLPGYNPTVIIDGNAVVDVEGQAAGIYVLGDSPNSVYDHEGVASINIGGNAQVTSAADFALYGYGGNVEVNIYDNADVDLIDSEYGIRMYGANLYTSISDKANVLIDAPASDGIGMTSETVSNAGVDNAAVLDISGDAVLKIKNAGALGVRAMIDPNVKDKNDNALVGDVAMIVSDNANVDITSKNQSVYLAAVAEGSTGTFGMFDNSNVSLVNQDVSGNFGSALTVYSAENNVEILSDGKLTAEGHAANWTAAFFVNAPKDGKTTVNIIDTQVDVTNVSNCAVDEKGFASDVSIAFCIAGEGVFTIGGDAVVNGYAEKNGEEAENRAFGLYLHPDMTMKVQDNAKATFGAGGDSETSKGAGIHVNDADIVVTDKATLKATAKGNTLAAMIFEKKATLVVNGNGWVDIDGGEVGGIRAATQASKPVITVDEGGLITVKGDPAYSKKGGKFTFKVHSALAGDDKASAEEVDVTKLTGKEAYIRLNGKNPSTSDFVVISVVIAAILAVAVAAVVIVIRRKKVQE